MKIYHLILFFCVLINGALSVRGARLKCPSVSIANGSFKIRSKGRIIVYKCSRGFYLLGEAYAACIKGKWDSSPPVCLRPGCPRLPNLLNGEMHESWRSSLMKFTCDPGYKLVGPSYIYCNGRQWSAVQPHCKAVDIKCNFENKTTCNWVIDDYDDDDDFNWRLQQHEPPSRVLKTGPLHDHTLSPNTTGHYLVLETSDYIPSSKPARIHSPVFPQPTDNSSCFIFWYHMYGNTIGTLNVFLNSVLAFQRQGNHGDRWIKGVISLSENVTSSDLQIIIEGSYGGGYTGDIGLDDFSIGNGTDCSSSAVKSCVGRCYEDKNDESSCLCNPECSVDASCCKDFLDVCSLESTTSFFEASTGVEDSTQVYSDTSGTTYYETSFSETPIPISSTELEFISAFEHSTSSNSFFSLEDLYSKKHIEQFEKTELLSTEDNIIYSSSTNPNIINKDNKKYQSSVHDILATEFHALGTSSFVQKGELTTSTEQTGIVNELSSSEGIVSTQYFLTTKQGTLSHLNSNTTGNNFDTDTTVATSIHFGHPFVTSNHHTEVVMEKLLTQFIYNQTKTSNIPRKVFSFNTSTDKTFIFNNQTENSDNTPSISLEMTPLAPIGSDLNKNLTTFEKKSFTLSSTAFHPTKVLQTTPIPNLTSIMTFRSVAKNLNPLVDEAYLPTNITISTKIVPVQSSTNITLKSLKSITPTLENRKLNSHATTLLPLFYNFTSLTSDEANITTSKFDNKKIDNDSHTHLQTTSRLPPLFYTTSEESASISSVLTNTVPIKHYTVSSPKKWISIYKPKDRFMFSAVQRNRDSENKTYITLLSCAAVIGVISILLVVLVVRKRRLRLVNELEEADTDILYHSSQEMLDLHVARPNH